MFNINTLDTVLCSNCYFAFKSINIPKPNQQGSIECCLNNIYQILEKPNDRKLFFLNKDDKTADSVFKKNWKVHNAKI